MRHTTYISMVVYVHNNEEHIKPFLLNMDDFLRHHFESYEIILVNDKSTDTTLEKVFEIKDEVQGNVIIVNLYDEHGIERAMSAGADIAIGDFIYEIEGMGMSFPMETIVAMYKESTEKGYDIVFANTDQRPNLSLGLYYAVMRRLSKGQLKLTHNKLRLVTRRALNSVIDRTDVISDRYTLYNKCGFASKDMTYRPKEPSKEAYTKVSKRIRNDFKLLVVYTDFFVRLPLGMSLLFFVSSVVLTLAVLFNRTFIETVFTKEWFIAVTLLFGFSLVFLTLSIVCRYLDAILTRQGHVRLYKVKNIERLNKY